MLRWIVPLLLLLCGTVPTLAVTGMGQVPPQGQPRRFTFYVREGWLPTPDGSQVYVWGFTDNPNGPPRVPGPAIVVDEGDTVELQRSKRQRAGFLTL